MKAIALGNRLARDLDVLSFLELPVDVRQEMLDAINGGLQKLHALAPPESKITTASIALAAPMTITIGVTAGSVEITGRDFEPSEYYRTIRIDGDDIDNQVIGTNELLHPYGGETGTVTATVYCDGVPIMEPYEELIGDPRILETGTLLVNCKRDPLNRHRNTGQPRIYQVEANAPNRNSAAPAVLRVDCLPERLYRLEGRFTLSPARIVLSDLLSSGADIPLRSEHVEAYLLPIARAAMTTSRLWKDKGTISQVNAAAEDAERKYEALVPRTLSTPNNQVRTRPGW